MLFEDETARGKWQCGLGRLAVVLAVASQIGHAALAGPFDPGRAGTVARSGALPVSARQVAVGATVTLPFQTTRGRSALAETRLAAGLALRMPPAFTAGSGVPRGVRARPLMQLSVEFAGRPGSLRLNGLPLLAPTALAAGEPASKDQETSRKRRKNQKWLWIGAGFLAAAAGVAIAGAVDDNSGKKFFDDFNGTGG